MSGAGFHGLGVPASRHPAPDETPIPAEPAPSWPESPWIVRGETLAAMRDAEHIRSRGRQEAERLLSDAARAAQRLGEEARRQGIAQGVAETGRLLAEAAEAVRTFRQGAEGELVSLAFAIAHRILGDFPEGERLQRAVDTALEEHRHASGLRLRVNPADAAGLRSVLATDGRAGTVMVEVDEEAPPGSCTLVHPRGRAAVGPLEQLRILFAASGGSAS